MAAGPGVVTVTVTVKFDVLILPEVSGTGVARILFLNSLIPRLTAAGFAPSLNCDVIDLAS